MAMTKRLSVCEAEPVYARCAAAGPAAVSGGQAPGSLVGAPPRPTASKLRRRARPRSDAVRV